MSTYGNTSIADDLRYQWQYGTMINKLIIVNFAVFIAFVLLRLVLVLFQMSGIYDAFAEYFMVPGSLGKLIFQPWSIITYMFFHEGFFHILFNMIVLYAFGRILNDFLGNRKILPIYVLGGIAGAVLYMLSMFLPVFANNNIADVSMMLGASAGVMSIMMAAVALRPDYQIMLVFLGAVRIKYIALFFILIDLVSIANLDNSGGHFAHIGGALFGYLFVKQLQVGTDWSLGFNKMMDSIVGYFEAKPKSRSSVENGNGSSNERKQRGRKRASRHFKTHVNPNPNARQPGSAKRSFDADKQAKVDAILDKISENGYESLSKEEKEFLFKIKKDD